MPKTDLQSRPDRQTQVGVKLRWLVALAVNWKFLSFRGGWIVSKREDDAAVPFRGFGQALRLAHRVNPSNG